MTPPRAARVQRALASALVSLAAAVGVTAGVTGAPKAAAATSGLVPVAEFPAGRQSDVFVDDRARLVYDVEAKNGITVHFRDADSLAPLGDVTMGGTIQRDSSQTNVGTVDRVHGRLFIGNTTATGVAVHVVDGRTRRQVGSLAMASLPSQIVQAVSYHEASDRVFVVLGGAFGFNNVPSVTTVVQLDPSKVAPGESAEVWRYDIPGCQMTAPALDQMPGVPADPARPFVYVLCTSLSFYATGPRPTQGIVRIHLVDGRPPSALEPLDIFPIPGDFAHGGVLFDPVSERVLIASRRFGPQGQFIFDGRQNAVVGLISHAGNVLGACIDVRTGRYYIAGDGAGNELNQGFSSGNIRPTPPDRGNAYPELGRTASTGAIACDGATRRVFSRHRLESGEYVYRVLRDDNPFYKEGEKADPDAYTHDVPDDATATVNYNGLGRAYGARVVQVAGPNGAVNNFVNNELLGFATGAQQSAGATRLLTLAPVGMGTHSVTLSDSAGAGAVAAGAVRDAATADDGSRAVSTVRDGEGTPDEFREAGLPEPWPYQPVSCSEAPGSPPKTVDDGGVHALCDTRNGVSQAVSQAQGLDGTVSLAGARAAARVFTDSDRGLVATAEASVDRVSVPEIGLLLERVSGRASSQARGRPGTAKAEFARSIGRAVLGDAVLCDGDCDPQAVVDAINRLPQHMVKAVLPRPAPTLLAGTPRGAASGVVRDHFEQLNDEILNRTSPDDQQVPALRLILQSDAFQHSAMIVDIAAPEAATLRSISPCAFCGEDAGGADPTRPELPILGGEDGDDRPLPDLIDVISPAPVQAPRAHRDKGILDRLVEPLIEGATAVARGIAAVLTSPEKLPLVAAVWAVLAVPIYLSSRRRLLVFEQPGGMT